MGQIELPPSGGSPDRTKSPGAVSQKREYSRIGPETFGALAPQNTEMGNWRPAAMSQKPAVCGPFFRSLGNVGDWPTAWLGREGSNLRMAKSKSAWHPLASADRRSSGLLRPTGRRDYLRPDIAATRVSSEIGALKSGGSERERQSASRLLCTGAQGHWNTWKSLAPAIPNPCHVLAAGTADGPKGFVSAQERSRC